MTVRESGRDAVMVNCNPETVSTDYDTSDRLYFEPLTLEDVLASSRSSSREGVIVQFGGQTPLKLAAGLERGRRAAARHERRRDRPRRGPRALRRAARRLGYQAPPYATARSVDEALDGAERSASRCSCAPPTCSAGARWRSSTRARASPTTCAARRARDGKAGARSSSTASWRTRSRSTSTRSATATRCGSAGSCSTSRRPACTRATAPACCRRTRSARRCSTQIRAATREIALALGVVGLINVQYAVHAGELYVIEANPRASRTVPFVSKAIGVPLAKLACRHHARRAHRRARPARRTPGDGSASTSRSRRRCCRSTASRAPTRCSARRCAPPAR